MSTINSRCFSENHDADNQEKKINFRSMLCCFQKSLIALNFGKITNAMLSVCLKEMHEGDGENVVEDAAVWLTWHLSCYYYDHCYT